ncbi:c-type cytochrome [Flexibacterium corallicola]|uniref:c-type cytochrome n=1 Tax=Flexibacterium corallicola TaxID=3037259 RepID=UPI00286F5472|nr:c-type cytochrome [Pseudovibrio sp. M1P-2-3]
MRKLGIGATCAAFVFAGAYYWHTPSSPLQSSTKAVPLVAVTLPASFSGKAKRGVQGFEENCAACHGANAAGQNGVAPPLIHKIYEPGHHGDESFQRAVAQGVRAHHWRFGNMPPIEGVSRKEVANIIAYIREVQQANGIN